MRAKIIEIKIVRHKDTGMYLAYSDDMKGLYVHARTARELDERIPVAIRDIYEAAGQPVEAVEVMADNGFEKIGFEPTSRRVQMLEAA